MHDLGKTNVHVATLNILCKDIQKSHTYCISMITHRLYKMFDSYK